MIKKKIDITDTPFTSKIVRDFLRSKKLNGFYSHKNEIDSYKKLIEKRSSFSKKQRDLLFNVLSNQYKNFSDMSLVANSIKKLRKNNTYTVTTGHQLCLNTGPLYFIYKILQTIKISDELNKFYPKSNFVPVFWMASEDHDFEEIRSFQTYNYKYQISSKSKDYCTGKIKPSDLSKVIEDLDKNFKSKPFKNEICELFKASYGKNITLAESTRNIVHTLFKDYGLVVVDADDKQFKTSFNELFTDEIINFSTYDLVNKTNKKLIDLYANDIKLQVNPRKLNLFYIENNIRYRLDFSDDSYTLVGKKVFFDKDQISSKIKDSSNQFSPNVLFRPLYQEFILPNLSYVGGNAEISYWLQLKSLFDYHNISFPILSLRNSIIMLNKRDFELMKRYKMDINDFFQSKDNFVKKIVEENIEMNISLNNEKNKLKNLYKNIIESVNKIDLNLNSSVKSSEAKQIAILESLEKKIVKFQKRNIKTTIKSLEKIYDKIYPENIFQERKINFSEFYSYKGNDLINSIYESISPFDNDLIIAEI